MNIERVRKAVHTNAVFDVKSLTYKMESNQVLIEGVREKESTLLQDLVDTENREN